MKGLIIASSVLIILASTMVGFNFAAKNHYLCENNRGEQTRAKENQAKSFPKYPNTTRYEVVSSCGGIDGSPHAAVEFYTPDNQEKVFDFYTNIFTNQGQKIVSRSNNMICTENRCIDYDSRQNRADGFKWWNVYITF